MTLKNVFSPININGIEIQNRVRMSPMALGYAEDGRSTERFARFFEERAKGGVGIIDWALWPYRTEHGYFPWTHDDKFIPGLAMTVDAVHKHGTKIVGQFGTGYGWAFGDGPVEIIGPSGVNLLGRPSTPFRVGTPTNAKRLLERPLTIQEIQIIVETYGQCAKRLRTAGFDGVELMLGAGYTLARFISTETNKRTDEYGGDLDGRMRIIREIIESIKNHAGSDFPILAKISGAQFTKHGYTLEECATEIVPRLVDMGICAVDVVVGWHEAPVGMLSNSVRPGQYLYLGETVKKNVKIPIICGDRTNDLRDAEKAISEGKIDIMTLGRQLLSDPATCNKAKEGRFEDIRPCMCCAWCLETVDTPCICSVNPRLGIEYQYSEEPPKAKKAKKILIVGGGPGGMEAALVAKQRGHDVTLMEKQDKVGGMLAVAAVAPHKEDTQYLVDYYRTQIAKSGIELKTGKAATLSDVFEMNPDEVIISTGTKPFIPKVPGMAKSNVILGTDVLMGKKEVGDMTVIIGGGMVGCEVAEFLLQKGKKMVMLEMLPRVASDVPRALRFDLMMRLKKAKLQMETDLMVTRITEYGVWGERTTFQYGPNEAFFEGDTIVVAAGYKSEHALAKELEGKVSVHRIGDSNKPGRVKDAIMDGYMTALKI
ncbi:MAG: dihydro-2-naphthoyl-CoA reductase [Pseudomonadota bacterium]